MDYVFLHGGGQGGWVWRKLIDALEQQSGGAYERLGMTCWGVARNAAATAAGVTVRKIADELVVDIENAGFKDVFMIGHSQASTIIPLMLERRPGLFKRVLYLACVAPAPGKTVQSFRRNVCPPKINLRHTSRRHEPKSINSSASCAMTWNPRKPTC